MTTPDHLTLIRELLSLRADRPRLVGESEQQYFQRIAHELEQRTRLPRRGRIVRVLRRDARVGA